MKHNQNLYLRLVREHFWGILLLVGLLIASSIAVKAWKAKHPGAMTVIESQAMDMTVMKPPVGAVPVATEVVHLGAFGAKVTYTGSVAPLQEQTIYPRVEGWLRNLNVYDGDNISQGQLIGSVDSPDLGSKVAEAAAGRAAAASEVPKARFDAARMASEKAAADGEIEAAKGEVSRAKAMVTAAEKTVIQKQKEVKSAEANLEYWKAEIAREEKLLEAEIGRASGRERVCVLV
jgi:multidrug efflux pump subunit AcrA (membrane-fusion protein)